MKRRHRLLLLAMAALLLVGTIALTSALAAPSWSPAGNLSVGRSSARPVLLASVNSSAACPARPFTSFGTWSITLP